MHRNSSKLFLKDVIISSKRLVSFVSALFECIYNVNISKKAKQSDESGGDWERKDYEGFFSIYLEEPHAGQKRTIYTTSSRLISPRGSRG